MVDNPHNSATEKRPAKGFNYCFWSKLLVAIVLFPLVALIVASFFTNIILKIVSIIIAIGAFIYIARWLDRLPCLSGMIPPLIGKKK